MQEAGDSLLYISHSVVEITADNETEDRHLILEFDVAEQWGSLKCPRANRLINCVAFRACVLMLAMSRFIVHRDRHTPFLTGLEEMQKKFTDFHPDVFVLGGLQMMDGFPYGEGLFHNCFRWSWSNSMSAIVLNTV